MWEVRGILCGKYADFCVGYQGNGSGDDREGIANDAEVGGT